MQPNEYEKRQIFVKNSLFLFGFSREAFLNKFIREFFVEVISISFLLNLKFRTPSWKQNCRNYHIYFRVKNIIFSKNGKSNMPIKSKRWEILKIKMKMRLQHSFEETK